MLQLPDSWSWDFWILKTEDTYELFFLYASKALHKEERRHRRAQIGRARSTDLRTWTRLPDAVVRSDAPAPDDVATWTGSTIVAPDGTYHLYYTGCSDTPAPNTQRVLRAVSQDALHWEKDGSFVLEADPRWYEKAGEGEWFDEAWRDPWVFYSEDTGLWHMLITARAKQGDTYERGVIGMATSPDLEEWSIQPPITASGTGFGQLEVNQVEQVDGRWVDVFCCLDSEMAPRKRAGASGGGTWLAYGESATGPFDIENAVQLSDSTGYAGRIVQDFDGQWQFLAFKSWIDGQFRGELSDPIPLAQILASGRPHTFTA